MVGLIFFISYGAAVRLFDSVSSTKLLPSCLRPHEALNAPVKTTFPCVVQGIYNL